LLPGNLLGSILYKISDSPLTVGGALKIALKDSPFGERGIRYLQRAQMMTMHRVSGASSSYFEGEPEVPKVEIEHHIPTLFEIIQKTSDIYLGALQTPPIPFSSPMNRKSTRALCRAVESPVNDDVWDRFPGIFI
jgi:hypothetical protein